MKKILLILLILPALACNSTLTQPAANLSMSVTTETAIPAPTPSKAITPTATASPETCEVTAEALHLRDAPNIDALVIAWLNQGDQLIILSTKPSGDWIQVQFQTITGWINSTYCERK